jgi:hypothetical protein
MRFFETLTLVIAFLQREQRVSYRALTCEFDLNEAYLEDLKFEIIKVKQLAVDQDGEILVWTGCMSPTVVPTVPTAFLLTTSPLTPENGQLAPVPAQPSAVPHFEARASVLAALPDSHDVRTTMPPGSARSAPEAERRQLTVMFCDLVGSTDLSDRLDPEDLREVVISWVTARLVGETFALVSLGLQTLKGLAEPLEVWRVDGLHEVQGEWLEGDGVDDAAPLLVGRDEEIGLLRRRWEQSQERLGQVVLIMGEAGIGKSALVEVLRAHVRREGRPRIAFRCSPYHQNSALYPVITHLHRLLQFERDEAPEAKLAKLEQGLQPYSLPATEVVPLLALLLSVPLPEGRYPALSLSPQQQRQQTLDALTAWLLAAAERQPLLVLWEDLHWADPTTVELLGLLIEQTPTAALLNVLTYRPEFVPPWPPCSHLTPLTLNRLERLQVEALITRLAGGKRLPPEVVAHIVMRADGVPLYVEELTKALLDSDLLQVQADQYQLTRPLAAVAIPTTLQDTLMARLDRLPTVREVAQLGVVLGREFAYEMLQGLATVEEPTLQDRLAQLVGAELLYQRGRPPPGRHTSLSTPWCKMPPISPSSGGPVSIIISKSQS